MGFAGSRGFFGTDVMKRSCSVVRFVVLRYGNGPFISISKNRIWHEEMLLVTYNGQQWRSMIKSGIGLTQCS